MKVYVVMSNDYPVEVFSTEELAAAYVEEADAKQRAKVTKEGSQPFVYTRPYEFEVDAKVPAAITSSLP
jgi:hypothetical protein